MTYPLSSDVIAGQPTAAEHYNNLRADALRLGQIPADSNTLAELLAQYQQNLSITILGTDRVRVPASTSLPVALVVDGYFILRSTVNVDLPIAGKPSGSADQWYLFAVRTSGSFSFTLEVNTSPIESSGRRLIGSFYWTGAAIDAATIRTSQADAINLLINHHQFAGCQGRLSTSFSVPTFDDDSASELYLVPYKGNQISFYTAGYGWNSYPIPYVSAPNLPLSGLNTAKCYDVFAYWDGLDVKLESLAWSNLTARATALTFQDGVYLKSTDTTRLYLGSFMPSIASLVNDYPYDRGIWNYFNRVPRYLKVVDTTASWTYTLAAWRSPNGADKKVRCMIGLAEDAATFELSVNNQAAASVFALLGIGVDSNTVNSADIMTMGGGTANRLTARAQLCSVLAAGCHDIYWLEAINGTGTVTFYGSPIADQSQAGLTGVVMG